MVLGLGAACFAAGAVLVTMAVHEHADVIRAVRAAGPGAVSFPTAADRAAGAANGVVMLGAACVLAAVAGAWLWARRVAVTMSLIAAAVLVPFAVGLWAVTTELRHELHTYETRDVRSPHPPPKG